MSGAMKPRVDTDALAKINNAFGGDRAAEKAFLESLRVCRRYTDGQPFDPRWGESAADGRA